MESSSPFWNQTFVYPDITLGQLRSQYLDISAWSHNYHAPSEFLGEITLDLSGKFIFSLMVFLSFQIRRTAPPHTFTKNESRVEFFFDQSEWSCFSSTYLLLGFSSNTNWLIKRFVNFRWKHVVNSSKVYDIIHHI